MPPPSGPTLGKAVGASDGVSDCVSVWSAPVVCGGDGLKESMVVIGKKNFTAHGSPGLERFLEIEAEGGDKVRGLWRLRQELYEKLAFRPQTNAESDYFRRTYVVGWEQGMSLKGARCLAPCTHVYSASSGEKQVWEHTTIFLEKLMVILEKCY